MSHGTQVNMSTLLKKVEINKETENVVSRTNVDLVTTAMPSNACYCTNSGF